MPGCPWTRPHGTRVHRPEPVEVDVEGGTDTTTYRATLSSDQVEPTAVTLVVMDAAMAALDAC